MRPRRRVLLIAALGVACLAVGSAASATTPLTYVTAAAMGGKIHGLVPQIPTDNTSPPSTITATSCRGLPPAHGKKFNTFRCSATWDNGRATLWARALPGGAYCASTTGLASCPVTTVVGDPRVCTIPSAPPTADPNRCALGATEQAILRAMPVNFNDPGWSIRNVSCTGSNLARKCTFSSHSAYGIYYTSAITFKQAEDATWAATIVTTGGGGGGSSTCTVQPGTPLRGSRWAQGPTPTCSAA